MENQLAVIPVEELKGIVTDAVEKGIKNAGTVGGDKLISPAEARKMLNIKSPKTLREMWKRGDLVMKMINNRPRILLSSVRKLING